MLVSDLSALKKMISFDFALRIEGDRAGRSIAFNFEDKIERNTKKQIYNFQNNFEYKVNPPLLRNFGEARE